jgi:hypothetical protein
LLLLEKISAPVKELLNQSSLTAKHYDYCKQLLRDYDYSWYQLGRELTCEYGFYLSKASLRRLHAKLKANIGTGPPRMSADELRTDYYQYASDVIGNNPSLSWYQLRGQLEKDHCVTASDGVFRRFYDELPTKRKPIKSLDALREHYTDIAYALMEKELTMTWCMLKARLRKYHDVNAHDGTMMMFYKELKSGEVARTRTLIQDRKIRDCK